MTPADTASEALNETLVAVQLLMKWCMILQQGNPEALKLSDEIARWLANDLKRHAGIATLFSPELLSCAAITPTAITRISSSSSSSGTLALVSLTTPPVTAVSTLVPPSGDIDHSSISAAPAIELSPLSPSPFSKALEPLTPLPVSAPILLKYNLFVPGIKNAVNAIPKSGNGKKRQVEDDQPVEAKLVDNSTSWSRKSVLKRKRVMSADEDNETTNPVLTQVVLSQCITKEDLALAHSHHSEGTDDRGFWDAESRPVEWGQDSAIATAVKSRRLRKNAGKGKGKGHSGRGSTDAYDVPIGASQGRNTNGEQYDLTVHHSWINTTTYAPPSHANIHLPAWLAQSDEDLHISAIGRQWTHAWDVSMMMGVQGHVSTSASAVLVTETVDSMVPAVDVLLDTSSDLSTISDD
ncbi:hypothetical protein BDR06DRAFT_969480 [Suillus hirtellus]|nr:hypothetical protein BDR06DRAFT_969480 [Suillus hirtellus]